MAEMVHAGAYRRIAISFVIAAVVFLAVVAFVVLPHASITIKPISGGIERSFNFSITKDITDDPTSLTLQGTLQRVEITSEKTFTATGEQAVSSNIEGAITIKNEYSKDQPLIATTRFLTSDGVLLRLKEGVTVPRGGSVQAEVYLDPDETRVAEITEGTLTIPGLWEGIQDQIYGVVTDTLTGPTETVTAVSEKDIIDAHQEVRELVEAAAIDSLSQNFKDNQDFDAETISSMELADIKIVEEIWSEDNPAGTEAETVTVTGTFTIEGVFYNPSNARQKVSTLLVNTLEDGESIIFDEGTVDVSLVGTGTSSSVLIEWSGNSQYNQLEKFVEESNITGLSAQQAEDILNNSEHIEFAQIVLSPFWVDTVPKNITINIE